MVGNLKCYNFICYREVVGYFEPGEKSLWRADLTRGKVDRKLFLHHIFKHLKQSCLPALGTAGLLGKVQ